jgi:hypothetical protein
MGKTVRMYLKKLIYIRITLKNISNMTYKTYKFTMPKNVFKLSEKELEKKFPLDATEETDDTGVIYAIVNRNDARAYIGKCYSFVKNGVEVHRKHGAQDRFNRHITAAMSGNLKLNDCPVFYDQIRAYKGDKTVWYVTTLKVSSKNHLKENETKAIKKYQTSDPEFGYNIFVGDNKPDNETHLVKYQEAKAASNVARAQDGSLKKVAANQGLPTNINYRKSVLPKGGKTIEGYFVQIKINGDIYNKAFMGSSMSMPEKLKLAIEKLEEFKKKAAAGVKPLAKPVAVVDTDSEESSDESESVPEPAPASAKTTRSPNRKDKFIEQVRDFLETDDLTAEMMADIKRTINKHRAKIIQEQLED